MRNTRNRVQDPLSFNSFPDSREVFPSNYSNPQSYYLSIPFRIPEHSSLGQSSHNLDFQFLSGFQRPFRLMTTYPSASFNSFPDSSKTLESEGWDMTVDFQFLSGFQWEHYISNMLFLYVFLSIPFRIPVGMLPVLARC